MMLYTVKETAELLKTSINKVYKLINAGMLPALKLGSLKIRKEALEKFLEDYEGFDISDVDHITKLDLQQLSDK